MNSSNGDRPQRRPGFPIRTPSDQRLVGSSPRLNAASHVLHRPTMPRHPPCALTTQHTYNKPHTHTHKHAWAAINHRKTRCSRPLSSSHTTPTPATHPTHGAHNQHSHQEQPHPTHKQGACVIPDTQQCTNTLNKHAYPLPSKKATHRQPLRARHTRTPLEHPPSTTKTHPHHQHSSANAQNIYSLERR